MAEPPSSVDSALHREAEELLFARLEQLVQASDSGGPPPPRIGALVDSLRRARPDLADAFDELKSCYEAGAVAVSDGQEASPESMFVTDRYEVRREIDAGGMGRVFEVYDRDLERMLAMKIARGRKRAGTIARGTWIARQARLKNEARVLAQLVHPGVVPVYDVGENDVGDVYFTMQIVVGDHLGTIIERVHDKMGSDWTITRLIDVLLRVFETVAYAHSRGVVHRDLKPSNIMVGQFGEAYLLDWGLAKILGGDGEEDAAGDGVDSVGKDDTQPSPLQVSIHRHEPVVLIPTIDGDVVGTPSYMAPEQARGDIAAIDERVDVYAAGSILYHALSGRRPYDDERSAKGMVHAVLAGPPKPLWRNSPGVSAELVAVTERAMERDPAARYPSMEALVHDLRAHLEGRVVEAHGGGYLKRALKWGRRNPAVAGLAPVVFLVLGVSLLLLNQRNLHLEEVTRSRLFAVSSAVLAGLDYDVREQLEEIPPKERGWEWGALYRGTNSVECVFEAASDASVAALDPTATFVAVGCYGGAVEFRNVSTGDVIGQVALNGEIQRGGLAFARDGTLWVGAGNRLVRLSLEPDGGVRVLVDTEIGNQVRVSPSPRGDWLLVSHEVNGRARVEIRDVAKMAVLHVVGSCNQVSRLDWSPDGALALVAPREVARNGERKTSVIVYDTRTGQALGLPGHEKWVQDVAANPSGTRLASAGWGGRVLIWSTDTWEIERELPARWPSHPQCRWLDDDRLVVGGARRTEIWSRFGSRPIAKLRGPARESIALSIESGCLSAMDGLGRVQVWRPNAAQFRREIETSAAGVALAAHPIDGTVAVGGFGGNVSILDVRSRSLEETRAPCRRYVFGYTPEGRFLVAGDGHGYMTLHPGPGEPQIFKCRPHRDKIVDVKVHPSRTEWVTAGADSQVKYWVLDGEKPRELWSMQKVGNGAWPRGAHGCAFSNDGTLVAVGANDHQLRIVESLTGRVVRTIAIEGSERVYSSPMFSPDDTKLVFRVWRRESRLVVWNLELDCLLWQKTESREAFCSPQFTEDGSRVLACVAGGELLVFEAESGQELVRLPSPSSGHVVKMVMVDGLLIAATEERLWFWGARGDSR